MFLIFLLFSTFAQAEEVSVSNFPLETRVKDYQNFAIHADNKFNYIKSVRERIRKYAYEHYKIPEGGVVSLKFELSLNGELLNIKLNRAKTKATKEAIKAAIDSIYNSSPFPPIPKYLAEKYKKRAFTIEIEF